MPWAFMILCIAIMASAAALYALLNVGADVLFKPDEPDENNKKTD